MGQQFEIAHDTMTNSAILTRRSRRNQSVSILPYFLLTINYFSFWGFGRCLRSFSFVYILPGEFVSIGTITRSSETG